MGQYYKIVNTTKKEFIEPWEYDSGAKLMEFSFMNDELKTNKFVSVLYNLIQNRWKGDNVYIVGDYADANWFENGEEITPKKAMKELAEQFTWLKEVDDNGYSDSLYFADRHGFTLLESYPCGEAKRYVLNTELNEYVDLASIKFHEEDGYTWGINPLTLLLAVGNNQGGGDYRPNNEEDDAQVGRWTLTSNAILFSDEKPEDMEELEIKFYEKW